MNARFPYLTDARDAALLGDCPLFMAPRFGRLPSLLPGQRRLVAARDGIYLQACNSVLAVCLRFAPTRDMPFGEVTESVSLAGGLLSFELFAALRARACALAPSEYAAVVVFDAGSARYRIVEPCVLSRSAGHVSYAELGLGNVVLDVHSHGIGAPFFSGTDDVSDVGEFYLSTVLGFCSRPDAVRAVTRVCVYGFFYELAWNPWEDGGHGG